MKYFTCFILALFFLYSCKENSVSTGEILSSDEQTLEMTDTLEENSEVSSDHFDESTQQIISFYNDVLSRMFPDRSLSVNSGDFHVPYDASLAEDIEGGGMSTSYLRVMENEVTEVGLIIYEDEHIKEEDFPQTLSMAILEPGNFLVHAQLTEIGNQAILRVSSNTSGNLDQGPFDFTYFVYATYLVNLNALHSVRSSEKDPVLSETTQQEIIEKRAPGLYGHFSGIACQEAMLENCVSDSYSLNFGFGGVVHVRQIGVYQCDLIGFFRDTENLTFLPLRYQNPGEAVDLTNLSDAPFNVPVMIDSYENNQDNVIWFKKGNRYIPQGKFAH